MNKYSRLAIVLSALMLLAVGIAYLRYSANLYQTAATPPLGQIQEPLWEAPDFTLVNRDGRTISKADLAGKVWAAAFIFTRCPGPCPLISQRMAEASRELKGVEGFRLVSFTVDPEYDTPAVLTEYAKIWKADPRQWYFLTGAQPSDSAMLDLARAFKIAAERSIPEGGEDPDLPNITHGTNILLVDQTGWVRGVFDSTEPDCADWIAKGARKLIGQP